VRYIDMRGGGVYPDFTRGLASVFPHVEGFETNPLDQYILLPACESFPLLRSKAPSGGRTPLVLNLECETGPHNPPYEDEYEKIWSEKRRGATTETHGRPLSVNVGVPSMRGKMEAYSRDE